MVIDGNWKNNFKIILSFWRWGGANTIVENSSWSLDDYYVYPIHGRDLVFVIALNNYYEMEIFPTAIDMDNKILQSKVFRNACVFIVQADINFGYLFFLKETSFFHRNSFLASIGWRLFYLLRSAKTITQRNFSKSKLHDMWLIHEPDEVSTKGWKDTVCQIQVIH